MGEPFRDAERPRDLIAEAYLLATKAGIADPLDLPCSVFDAFLRLVGRGEVVRANGGGHPCRSYVEDWLARGG
jgi:hypothetical protein